MSIKTAIFGKPKMEEICKKIANDKGLSDQEKLNKILANYIKYFNTRYVYDVNFAVFEKYYEHFTLPNGKKDGEKYAKVFNKTMAYYTMCQMVSLHKIYSSFKDINKSKLSDIQLRLVQNLEQFGKLEKEINNQTDLYSKEPKITQAFDIINDKTLKDCTNGLVSIHFFTEEKILEK